MKQDIPFQITNLLFLLVPVGKALIDVYLFQKRNIPVRHKEGMLIAVILGVIISYIDVTYSNVMFFQSCVLSVGTFWLIFDYLRNILAGENMFYVDRNPKSDAAEDSWWDVHIYSKMTPLSLFIAKVWFLVVCYGVYYFLSYIL